MYLMKMERGGLRERCQWGKKWVKEGIRNSQLQKHFRTRNSL
jgi:hypothetical protein